MVLPCGCTPDASGFGWCGKCVNGLREKIWKNMDKKKKNCDRHFAPEMAERYDEGDFGDRSCSCHINPPCSYCVSELEKAAKELEEEEIENDHLPT